MTSTYRIYIVTVLVGSAFFVAAMAYADIIEVRGKGIMNGKILSETAVETRFVDAAGHELVFPKKDVLFSEIQPEAPKANKLFENAKQLIKKTAATLSTAPHIKIPWTPQSVAPQDVSDVDEEQPLSSVNYAEKARAQRARVRKEYLSTAVLAKEDGPRHFETFNSDDANPIDARIDSVGSTMARFKEQGHLAKIGYKRRSLSSDDY